MTHRAANLFASVMKNSEPAGSKRKCDRRRFLLEQPMSIPQSGQPLSTRCRFELTVSKPVHGGVRCRRAQ